MDQAFKENVHSFMLGLEVVLVAITAAFFIAYFVIKRRIKKKKELNKE